MCGSNELVILSVQCLLMVLVEDEMDNSQVVTEQVKRIRNLVVLGKKYLRQD